MNRFKANQKLLFKAKTVFNLRPLEKYEILFSFLDTSSLEILYPSTGRLPIPYEALFKTFIYKNFKNISYLSDLVRELQDNPDLALVLGFHPWFSLNKTDTQLSDHGHFFIFFRTMIPEKRM